MVSHIGSTAAATYISSINHSVQVHVHLRERVLATEPDGIVVPVVDGGAFEGPLRKAIDMGIPVVAFNIPDGRPVNERIACFTCVGGNAYLIGAHPGPHMLSQAEAGVIPGPTGVVWVIHDGPTRA